MACPAASTSEFVDVVVREGAGGVGRSLRPAPKALSSRRSESTRLKKRHVNISVDPESTPDFTFPTLLAAGMWRNSPSKSDARKDVGRNMLKKVERLDGNDHHEDNSVWDGYKEHCQPVAPSFRVPHLDADVTTAATRAPPPSPEDHSGVSLPELQQPLEVEHLRWQLEALKASRSRAQAEVVKLQRTMEEERRERKELHERLVSQRRQVIELELALGAEKELRAKAESSAARSLPPIHPGGVLSQDCAEEEIAKRVASMEVDALSRVEGGDCRAQARRRVQAKWHPDKNAHSISFATRVMQEMQQHPAWSRGVA